MKTCPCCGSKKWCVFSTGQIQCSQCGLTRKLFKNLSKKSRISHYGKGKLIVYFCLGVPAYRLRFQVPYSQLTIQRCYGMLREILYQNAIKDLKPLSGEIEMDETMMPFIDRYTQTGSLYYTDNWFAYTSLPIRGNSTKREEVPKGRNHINDIEGFWSFAKH